MASLFRSRSHQSVWCGIRAICPLIFNEDFKDDSVAKHGLQNLLLFSMSLLLNLCMVLACTDRQLRRIRCGLLNMRSSLVWAKQLLHMAISHVVSHRTEPCLSSSNPKIFILEKEKSFKPKRMVDLCPPEVAAALRDPNKFIRRSDLELEAAVEGTTPIKVYWDRNLANDRQFRIWFVKELARLGL
eukprot:5007864-Karenia_brevis.AAC.1